MKGWDEYWNSGSVNRKIMEVWAACFVGAYKKNFKLQSEDVVLDFGAGHGNVSSLIRDDVRHIYLHDKSEVMRKILLNTFQERSNVQVISDLNEIREKVTVIVVNSVSQYIDKADFNKIVGAFAKLSGPQTKLVISDVIPTDYSVMSDFLQQLLLGLRHGFFMKLLAYALGNIYFSPSMVISGDQLVKYDQEEIIHLLEEQGFDARIAPVNFTCSRKRFTVIASPKISVK